MSICCQYYSVLYHKRLEAKVAFKYDLKCHVGYSIAGQEVLNCAFSGDWPRLIRISLSIVGVVHTQL